MFFQYVMLLSLVQFCLLFLACEGRKGGDNWGKSRPQRWWHVAESEVDCGNYTQLMKDERLTYLCLEVMNTIFILLNVYEHIETTTQILVGHLLLYLHNKVRPLSNNS